MIRAVKFKGKNMRNIEDTSRMGLISVNTNLRFEKTYSTFLSQIPEKMSSLISKNSNN